MKKTLAWGVVNKETDALCCAYVSREEARCEKSPDDRIARVEVKEVK